MFSIDQKRMKNVYLFRFLKAVLKPSSSLGLRISHFSPNFKFLTVFIFQQFQKKKTKVSNSIEQTGTQNRLFNTKQD